MRFGIAGWLRASAARLTGLVGRRRADRELADELDAHLRLATDENIRRGMAPGDARRRAILDSGGLEIAKEAVRDQRGIPLVETLARDARASLRSLGNSRGFTATVVTTLALAIGANTVIFSAVEAVLLRPIPVAHLDRLVIVGRRDLSTDSYSGSNAAEIFALEDRRDLFDAIAGYRPVDLNLTGSGEPQRVAAVTTTGGFFDVFGVRPYLGRLYTSDDERRGATSVVVLSYGAWKDITGGDVSAVGRPLHFNDSSYTLLGVLPPNFDYPIGVQLWTPKTLDIYLDRHGRDDLQHDVYGTSTVARMRPDMTLPRLQSELSAALRGWAETRPEMYKIVARTHPIEARAFVAASAGRLRPILIVLVGAVALVLVIACANVGSLQLLRTTGRAREIALRIALGASVSAVVRQFAVETLLLAGAGGTLGVAVAELLVVATRRMAAVQVPELGDLHLDLFALACAAGVTVLSAVLFGIVPVLRAARTDPRDVLAATSARGHSSSVGRSRLLRGAVVVQVALALVLVLTCGIAVRSLSRLMAVDPGFDASDVVTARLVLPQSRYNTGSIANVSIANAARMLAFHELLLRRIRALPGIEAASTVDVAPFDYSGVADANTHRTVATATIGPDAMQTSVTANMWKIDADYFRTMRIPILAGRDFTGREQDDQVVAYPKSLQWDVVIDAALAHRLFPGENAVGKLVGPFAPGYRVIGVVGTVKKFDLTAGPAEAGAIYLAILGTQNALTLVVRTKLPVERAATLLRGAVHEIDPELPLFDVGRLATTVSRSAGPRQIASWLLSGFAALSLLLALLGVYGVLSYGASQRTKEMGIRLALGAAPAEILRIIIRAGAALAGAGLLAGALGYLALERELSAIIYGVNGRDPIMIATAVALLGAAALAASLPAAIRAARVNPVEALRAD